MNNFVSNIQKCTTRSTPHFICKRIPCGNSWNSFDNKVLFIRRQKSAAATKRKKKMNFAKDKMQKMKNTINANRVVEDRPKRKIIENAEALKKAAATTPASDETTAKLNTFLFLGVFPIFATCTLAYFNDDMREDMYNKLGINSGDK